MTKGQMKSKMNNLTKIMIEESYHLNLIWIAKNECKWKRCNYSFIIITQDVGSQSIFLHIITHIKDQDTERKIARKTSLKYL